MMHPAPDFFPVCPSRPALAGFAAWVVLCATLVIAAALFNPSYFMAPDSPTYVEPAHNLLASQGFTDAQGEKETTRTPGYSIFLAGVFGLFGDDAWLAVVAAQFILVLITAVVTRRVCRGLGQEPAGCRAAFWIALFAPVLLLTSLRLLTESLFTGTSMAGAGLLAIGLNEERKSLVFSGMALTTASAFIRPVALYLPWILAVAATIFLLRRRSYRLLAVLAAGLVLHAAAVGFWSTRNASVEGEPVFATVQQVNLYSYIAASIEARAQGRNWLTVRKEFRTHLETIPHDERQSFMRRQALQTIAAHPVEAAQVWLRGALMLLFQPATGQLPELLGLRQPDSGILSDYISRGPFEFARHMWIEERLLTLCLAVGALWLLPFWLFTLLGVGRMARGLDAGSLILLTQAAYLFVVSSGPQTVDRFRAPLIPLCAVFAGPALVYFWRKLNTLKTKR